MNRILITAGLACLIAAIVGGGLKAFSEDGNIFPIPTAKITIDGNPEDWQGIKRVLVDEENDNSTPGLTGTDLNEFYLARDNKYLYLAMTLHDGLPQWNTTTVYFFVANQQRFQRDVPGDMEAVVIFSQGNWEVRTDVRGYRGRPVEGTQKFHFPSYVASRPNFIEWKVPLENMGDLNGRFVRVYIHVMGQSVSDENLPGTELTLKRVGPQPLTPNLRGLTIPEAEQQHAELRLQLNVRGRRYSLEPAEKIIDQDPKPGTPLPPNRRAGVWLSRSVLPLLLVGIASVAVIMGLLVGVLRWLRPDGHRPPTDRSPVHFRPHPDPGNQAVEAEAGEWALPSISVRFRMDHGVQEIEQSAVRDEE